MNKTVKILLIVEVQLILGLVVFGLFKMNQVEDKVYNTNSFVYQLLEDKNVKALSKPKSDDIVIGDSNAPVSIVMYSKFTCKYCKRFFVETYPELYQQYIEPGYVSLTIRYLVAPKSEQSKLAGLAYQSSQAGLFLPFNEMTESLDDVTNVDQQVKELIESLGLGEALSFDKIIKSKFKEASSAGITNTPTFIINGKTYVGNRKMKLFNKEISEALEMCEN